jgi:hypothetical protein
MSHLYDFLLHHNENKHYRDKMVFTLKGECLSYDCDGGGGGGATAGQTLGSALDLPQWFTFFIFLRRHFEIRA